MDFQPDVARLDSLAVEADALELLEIYCNSCLIDQSINLTMLRSSNIFSLITLTKCGGWRASLRYMFDKLAIVVRSMDCHIMPKVYSIHL